MSISTSTSTSATEFGGTTTYGVIGMTCGHCVAAVTDEVGAVPGVSAVTVDLVVGGASVVTVTSDSAPDQDLIAAAVDEAGYTLAPAAV